MTGALLAGTDRTRKISPAISPRTRSSRPVRPTAVLTGPPALRLSPTSPAAATVAEEQPRDPGQPLLPSVRAALEPVLEVPLDHVRVHTDTGSSEAAKRLGARAFAYGPHIFLGSGQSPSDLGLMAHEVAHVVQQQSAPAIQRSATGQSDRYEREAQQVSASAMRGERFTVQERANPRIQRWGLSSVLNYFADKVNLIPGFRMFTIVLGVNPINMSPVQRNAANIMRAIVEFIPGGGLITQALDNYGVFDKVGGWVEEQLRTLGMVGGALKQALDKFLDSLHLSDILSPGDVWERAKRIFTEPIDRLKEFAKGLLNGILKFIKDAILKPLAKLAEGTRGWDLLIAVLGQNPITGEPVPRTAETLIGGFMKLIGQEEVWENIKKANAIPRAWAWFQGALNDLLAFVRQIPTLFIQALKSLELADIVLLPRALLKVGSVFAGFIVQFLSWAGKSVWNLLQIIFEVVAPGVMPYLKKVGAAFRKILQNPIAFVGNLVKAGKQGFQQFADKIGTHLKNAFIDWLTGSLEGVYIPKALEFREILQFVLSVLGLTWQNIRTKLVKLLGEPVVKTLETTFDIVVALVTEGPAAAWAKIKEQLSNLKDMVMQGIMDFIIETVVKKAIAKIIGFLIPGAAFIQAIITIYDTVMVFIDKLKKIAQVVKAFLDSIMDIANGVVTAAANKVESTLAGLLSLAISFLAGFVGLGKIATKVMDIINKKIRQPLDQAIDKFLAWIVMMAKKLYGAAAGKIKKALGWQGTKSTFQDSDGKSHSVSVVDAAGKPQLQVASTPMAIRDFVKFYVDQKDEKFRSTNIKLLASIDTSIDKAQKLVSDIQSLEQKKKDDPAIEGKLNELLKQNVELSGLLADLLKDDKSIGKLKEKYALEGLTGTYGSIPKPPGDDFTADHQPQAAVLQAAAEFDYFKELGEESALARRAKGRAKAGYAINLHKIRHEAGATYGAKGKQTKAAFLDDIETSTKGIKGSAAKRTVVVDKIRKDMNRDADAMTKVVQEKAAHANWSDIANINSGSKEEKEKIVSDVRSRIVSGEKQVKAQDIDSLLG